MSGRFLGMSGRLKMKMPRKRGAFSVMYAVIS